MTDEQYAALDAKLDEILLRLGKPTSDAEPGRPMSLAELQQALAAVQAKRGSIYEAVPPAEMMLRLMLIQHHLAASEEQFAQHLSSHSLSIPTTQFKQLVDMIEQELAGRIRSQIPGPSRGGVF